jgi:hypothetical protein
MGIRRSFQAFVLLAVFLGISSAFAASRVDQTFATLKAQRAKGNGELIKYVNRAGEGLVWANAALARSGGAPLFCAPEDVHYADVALRQYQRHPSRYTKAFRGYAGEAVVVALMDGLQRTYPCKS